MPLGNLLTIFSVYACTGSADFKLIKDYNNDEQGIGT